jgi:hypothetical protein
LSSIINKEREVKFATLTLQTVLINNDKHELAWRELGLEQIHGNHINQHDPLGTVEQVGLVPHKDECGQTLPLQLSSVRVRPLELSAHVLLELFEVKQLRQKEKRNTMYVTPPKKNQINM